MILQLNPRSYSFTSSNDNPNLKGNPFLVVTNRKNWERTRILLTYHDRWPTETFNEDIKGDLGFEEYQLHKLSGIRRHWYLCLAAYSLLGEQGCPGRSRQGVRAPFESTGQSYRAVIDETLGHLVEWLAQQLKVVYQPQPSHKHCWPNPLGQYSLFLTRRMKAYPFQMLAGFFVLVRFASIQDATFGSSFCHSSAIASQKSSFNKKDTQDRVFVMI